MRMPAPRLFHRDRRNRALRISLAVLLSVAAHVALIAGVRASAFVASAQPGARILEARLVASRAAPATAMQAASGPPPAASKPEPDRAPAKASQRRAFPPAAPREEAPSAPVAALPLPFDAAFYTWREVDVTAKLQGDGSPQYPQAAREKGLSGRVLIEVWVDETGRVDEAKVLDAEPPGYFEEATLAHYRALRFSPAMKDGKARRFRTRFLVDFEEPSTTSDASPR